MTTATDTLRGALDRHDRGVPDQSVGEHGAPSSATGSRREDDDLRLIARVAAKDQRAFTILYQRYAPRLGRFLSKSLKSDALVNETVNDTMLVVWRKASQFDPDRARVSTWLFGIAHHAGLKALARSAKESCAPRPIGETRDRDEPESTHDPATTVLGWELGRELMAALEQLSPDHRAVIELTFVEGFSFPQIASIVGCPENTVKTRMFHARRRLAQILSHLELEGARAYAAA
ncbi:MAG: RNA polymerase sigma factor [Gammaproteobacteria bacterium]